MSDSFRPKVDIRLSGPLVHQKLNGIPACFQFKTNGTRACVTPSDLNPIHKYSTGIIKTLLPGAIVMVVSAATFTAGIQRDQIAAGGRKVQFGRVGHLIHDHGRHGANIAE